jgi:RimJ/RimL family protein N-acetyltransferase
MSAIPTVRLRPLTLDDARVLEAAAAVPEPGGFEWMGFLTPGRLQKLLNSGEPTIRPGGIDGRLAVALVEDDSVIGDVGWHPEHYGMNLVPAINFGIGLLPEARGNGYGTQAQRLLVDYLFQTTTVNRVEASTDVDNIAEQRSLEKVGLRREGVARGAQYRNGEYRDMATYGILRADWIELRAGRTATAIRTGFSAS